MDLQAFVKTLDVKPWWDAPSEEIPPWNKGQKTGKLPKSTREKMRLAKLGKKRGPNKKKWKDSPETKAKKSAAAKKSWINNDERRNALIERNRMRKREI